MPLYDYACGGCSGVKEIFAPMGHAPPLCCGQPMRRRYSLHWLGVRVFGARWIDRMDDIHKAQAQRGERLRYVHPSEIRAS